MTGKPCFPDAGEMLRGARQTEKGTVLHAEAGALLKTRDAGRQTYIIVVHQGNQIFGPFASKISRNSGMEVLRLFHR